MHLERSSDISNGEATTVGSISENGISHSFDDRSLESFIDSVRSAQTEYDIFKLLKGICAEHNFERFLVTRQPRDGSFTTRIGEFVVLTNWRPELLHKCIESDFFSKFDVYPQLAESAVPVTRDWREEIQTVTDDTSQRQMAMLIENGHCGIAYIPCRTHSMVGGVSYAGERGKCSHTEMQRIAYRSSHLFARLEEVRETSLENNPLSAREIECLKALASGQTQVEVGHSLSLSEHTVSYHVASACRKLGAKNTINAIAIVFEKGWLR
ncbi:MAG: hypothetical protein JJ913_02225 [Rhizobiaceae bacterium]|nr:hypothetical protein [Rhizobiaceae bacterium]